MNRLQFYLMHAVSIANCIHNKISPEERLIPIILDDVIKYREDIIVKYADLKGLDGFTVYDEITKKYLVAIDNANFEYERQRFTLAHELGHVFLKHHTKNKNLPEYIQEQSADAFAGELLMPLNMMFKTARFPDNYILNTFGVSHSAFKCRKAFLNRYYNFYEKTKNQKIIHFEDIVYDTKYSLGLRSRKKVE